MDRSHLLKIEHNRDFPGGPVVKNPSSSTGDVVFIVCREIKIPHTAGQQSPRTTTKSHLRIEYYDEYFFKTTDLFVNYAINGFFSF